MDNLEKELTAIFHIKRILFNRALRILLITNSLILLAAAMLAPIYALFVEEIGGDLFAAGLTGSAFAFAAGITVFLIGKYTDKVKRKELIVAFGYFLMGLGFLLCIFVSSIWMLIFAQIVIGLGQAVYGPAFDALYSEHLDKGKTATEWSAWESMYYMSTGIGAILGGFIASQFGFDLLFGLMGVLCFASALYIYHIRGKVLEA